MIREPDYQNKDPTSLSISHHLYENRTICPDLSTSLDGQFRHYKDRLLSYFLEEDHPQRQQESNDVTVGSIMVSFLLLCAYK
jgi:hypothetical protein